MATQDPSRQDPSRQDLSHQDPSWDAFLFLFRRSGLSLPDERLPVLFAAFREVETWSETIRHRDNQPGDEPANAFSVASIRRLLDARP